MPLREAEAVMLENEQQRAEIERGLREISNILKLILRSLEEIDSQPQRVQYTGESARKLIEGDQIVPNVADGAFGEFARFLESNTPTLKSNLRPSTANVVKFAAQRRS